MAVAQSSHLSNYSYDPNTDTLTIQFQNGAIYQYAEVPINVFYSMSQSGGAGTFFHAKIRDQYPTTKIYDPKKG
jgi:lysyl-tRNA synthetase class 2